MSMEATAARRPATRPARRGTGPEARIQAACVRVLERQLGALVNRSNAGSWEMDGRHIQGADKGTGDLTVLLPGGWYCEIECKRPDGGRQSEAQRQRQAAVEARGGVYLLISDPDQIRPALVQRFGAAVVERWERAACAAWDAAQAERAVKRQPAHKRPGGRKPTENREVSPMDEDVPDLF